MKNARDERGARWRTRCAAAVAVGAVMVLAPSAWSQDRGQCARIEAPWPMVLPVFYHNDPRTGQQLHRYDNRVPILPNHNTFIVVKFLPSSAATATSVYVDKMEM